MEAHNSDKHNTRQIIYKGKIKEIPKSNSDCKLCEFYIIARMRYCKFEKHAGSEFCIYHLPNDTVPDVVFVDCPIDPSHRVMAEKLKRHVKVCNKLGEKKKLTENPWYKEKINKVFKNESVLLTSEENILALKWEDLSEEEYCQTLDKIKQCYEMLKSDYLKYVESEELQKLLNEKLVNKLSIESDNFNMSISGTHISEEDFQFTKDLPKSEKNGKQNKAISDVLSIFDLLNKNDVYIEFGAGKGGLSHYINTLTNDQSIHILLEREGVRYKRDKYSDNLIRFRTDILDFDINYLNKFFSEKEELKEMENNNFKILGVAKHICGCAFDLSLTCLNNYIKKEKLKAICMATCCHHLCTLENLNNLDFYQNYLKLSLRETILLFKATSWIFGPIEINDDSSSIKSNQLFIKKGLRKNYIGLISKYVVDLARVFYLISIDYQVFYLKYCKNEITTENNLILAVKNNN